MIVVYAVLLLGILIFVHELGHFLVAKMLGVKVLKFSLGFGPKVFGRAYGDTEYRISAVPLGGYVKMLGEDPGEVLPESERAMAYSSQPVWKRFSIVATGPLFNFLFAAVLFIFIFLSGVPAPLPDIGRVDEDSPAASAGLMTGDRVIEIDGKAVESWGDISLALNDSNGQRLLFRVKRDETFAEISVVPEKKSVRNIFGESEEIWDIGVEPFLSTEIGEIVKDAPAYKAGLQTGDRITEIDGTELATWQDMTEIIHNSPEKPLGFTVERDSRILNLTIVPERKSYSTPTGEEKELGLIGIKPAGNDFIKRHGPVDAVSLGIKRTWDISVFTLIAIGKLIQRVIPADTIGGPILILQMAGKQASQGALDFFGFMAVISINLAILNLLPIPILDGGHLMFLGIEAIRRRPLSENVIMVAQKVGLVLLLTLMVFAFYNDIVRLVTGKLFL